MEYLSSGISGSSNAPLCGTVSDDTEAYIMGFSNMTEAEAKAFDMPDNPTSLADHSGESVLGWSPMLITPMIVEKPPNVLQ